MTRLVHVAIRRGDHDERRLAVDRLRRSVADAGKAAGGRIAQGLNATFGGRAADRFGIIYYHRVAEPPRGSASPTLNVTPARFRHQVEGLLARGFRFMTVGSMLALAERGEAFPARTAVITFDDGYLGVHRHAWPVLRELGVPATLFLATSFVGTDRPFPFDPWGREHSTSTPPEAWAPLTWGDCREMAEQGLVEIGSHTHSHADLRGRPEAFRDDLEESLKAIRDGVGTSTTLLSFPFGNVHKGFAGEDLITEARRVGIRCGLTTEMTLIQPGASAFRWGRFEGVDSDTPATLEAKLEGWYTWMETGRRLFQTIV